MAYITINATTSLTFDVGVAEDGETVITVSSDNHMDVVEIRTEGALAEGVPQLLADAGLQATQELLQAQANAGPQGG